MRLGIALLIVAATFLLPAAAAHSADNEHSNQPETLPGTKPLTLEGDIASKLVDGVDKFLLRKIVESVGRREQYWNRDFSSPEAYNKSIEPNRKRLAHILGVHDPRISFEAPELVATTNRSALVGKGDGYEIFAVRWPVLDDPDPNRDTVIVHGEGLLLVPTDKKPIANIVAIPDADQNPEQIAGLTEGLPAKAQFARRLAESGCRVLVPMLISREMKKRNGRANLTNREYLYRPAFELGRHIIGYEVQKILAGVDWFTREAGDAEPKIGIIGYGEGGMLALYAGALDTRIDGVYCSGYFAPRETLWQQPIDRNVFGLLREFGDAELAGLVAPRIFFADDAKVSPVNLPGEGGAPATIPPLDKTTHEEFRRAVRLTQSSPPLPGYAFSFYGRNSGDPAPVAVDIFLNELVSGKESGDLYRKSKDSPRVNSTLPDVAARQQRQIEEIDRHNQLLLRESPFVRKEFMSKLDTSSLEAYKKTVEPYRKIFAEEVIGTFDEKPLPFNPRTRKAYDEEKWTGYQVVLDVFPDVIAYGVLLLPKDIQPGEKRPVVVCQHGLEGRPEDVITGNHRAYYDFAAKLAERGFITFAPQNLYIFRDRFRTLQRKANPLGKTLFSIIVPQHQQIVDWLQSLPHVDPDRVAFYGLSYGGKTAMRVPALVTDYCLSICSADFNEWVRKNASTRHPFSYVWTGEYEIFEFDLGSTFNYAEMAALICPRPFMVERGHFDGVGWDEWVAYEYAKVRHLYQAKLGIGDRTEIEWFAGPHTIHGEGTFAFLHKHLSWPEAEE